MSITTTDLQTRVHGLEVHVEELTKDFTALQKKYESIVQKSIKAPGDHLYYCMKCQDKLNVFFSDQIKKKREGDYFVYTLACPTCETPSSSTTFHSGCDISDSATNKAKDQLKANMIAKGILVVKEESKANQ